MPQPTCHPEKRYMYCMCIPHCLHHTYLQPSAVYDRQAYVKRCQDRAGGSMPRGGSRHAKAKNHDKTLLITANLAEEAAPAITHALQGYLCDVLQLEAGRTRV